MPDWVPAIVSDRGNTGWGGSTTDSVKRLMQGVEPTDSGEPKGAGNGVLMKMAPLVYWQAAGETPPEQATQQVIALTRMTHKAPEAVVSSLVHANVLRRLMDTRLESDMKLDKDFLDFTAWYADSVEHELGVPQITSNYLGKLATAAEDEDFEPVEILRLVPNHGFYAPETLVMAYGSFMRESRYPQSVYRGVELGGDADSVGSIVATMSVFTYGAVEKPHDYDQVFDMPRLERISRRLAKTALLNR
jgi:ADP-ribosylglycohydrolase